MFKLGRWTTLLFGLALIAVLASCTGKGTVMISFATANNESAWFPIDVAVWMAHERYPGSIEYSYTVNDATADLQASLIDVNTGQSSNCRAVRLDSYIVTWNNSLARIPTRHGALDVTLPADPNSSKPAKFTILVMPAVDKETLQVLSNLRGDPSPGDPNTFVGELITTATITFSGSDLATGKEVEASLDLTAVFADFLDPNSYH
jgi:hypothetical protein